MVYESNYEITKLWFCGTTAWMALTNIILSGRMRTQAHITYTHLHDCVLEMAKRPTVSESKLTVTSKREGCSWGEITGDFFFNNDNVLLFALRCVGSKEIPQVIGKFGLGVQNEAGQRLIEFCQENTLVTANTLFQQHKRRP